MGQGVKFFCFCFILRGKEGAGGGRCEETSVRVWSHNVGYT